LTAQDPVTKLLWKAKHRLAKAERDVASLNALLAHGALADSQRAQTRAVLAAKEIERDEARRDLDALEAKPRWALERELRQASAE